MGTMTTTESGSPAKIESRAGGKPARPWSSHRMQRSTSGRKKPNDNRRIVTDGGEEITDINPTRITDKADLVALDGTEYPDEDVTRHTTVSVSVLQQSLELLDQLGWETIDIGTVAPVGCNLPLLAIQPPSDTLLAGEQAAITVAPMTEKGREKAKRHDDSEENDIVTDGGQPADDEPDNYIDPTAGGEDYTKIRVSVSDNELESLANGFGTTREWTTDNGETIAVFVDPKREADKDWLLEEIGAKETAEPQVYKTIGALAVFGGSLSVAATLAPAWTMIPAAIPMLVAGIWIIDELRRGYNSPQPADEEATA